jgi:hypothetical protein
LDLNETKVCNFQAEDIARTNAKIPENEALYTIYDDDDECSNDKLVFSLSRNQKRNLSKYKEDGLKLFYCQEIIFRHTYSGYRRKQNSYSISRIFIVCGTYYVYEMLTFN